MKKYIPQSKDDIQATSYLKECSFQEVRQDIPSLLEWMQDMHWEVAHDIGAYLIPHVNHIKFDLLKILRSNDNEWKFGIILFLIAKSSQPLDQELIEELKRIASTPSDGERIEGIDEIAYNIVKER